MSTINVTPKSIESIKRLAKSIRAERGITYTAALNAAARAGSYQNFAHARNILADGISRQKPSHAVFVTIRWFDRKKKIRGRETIELQLSKPLDDLLTVTQMKYVRHLGGMQRAAGDHLVGYSHDQDRARMDACQAARSLQFMDITGLKPSNSRRSYPKGEFQNRIPGHDHGSTWYDPIAKQHVLVDEPYAANPAERAEWARRHGWQAVRSPWRGMYYPDGGAQLWIAADINKGFSLDPVLARLAAAPQPLIIEDWTGISATTDEWFMSPGEIAETAAKAAAQSAKVLEPRAPRGPVNTVPLGRHGRRRPRGRMAIDDHAEVGRLIKSVLVCVRGRNGAYKRLGAVRSDLEDWMSSEYPGDEIPPDRFFEIYYHESDDEGGVPKGPAGCPVFVERLTAAKKLLAKRYPDCPPLREILRQIDFAMESLVKWAR